ncbi:MAG: pantetheine-phosphate adenylyltransferase [Victivallaceae bacterium]|nr:pantetheine-phosphate adenylyltransferase [Victivallaceae bacterium]
MKTVLYPGSFDPFTNGHLDLVVRAGKLFDRVIVAVAVNPGKQPMFTLAERESLILEACRDLPNVQVVSFTGLLVEAIETLHADAVLRGLRAFSDFEYELQMALMNRGLKRDCETIFLTPTLKNSFVASSLIKEVARLGGDFSKYVPPTVAVAISAKIAQEQTFHD